MDGVIEDPLTPEQARKFGQALIEAAEEADKMNSYDQITVS